ncbi:hypothetical protein RI367_006813 [Sorochytrium milnesiophthora]
MATAQQIADYIPADACISSRGDWRIHVVETDPSDGLAAVFPTAGDKTQLCQRKLVLITQGDVVVAGFTSFEYTFGADQPLRSLVYIDRVDSTGATDGICSHVLKAYIAQLCQDLQRSRPFELHVSARAAPVYLFPQSPGNASKRVLTDHELVKWWLRMLDSVASELDNSSVQLYCWMTGSTSLPASLSAHLKQTWAFGYPADDAAPAASAIPRLPDDDKGRLLDDERGALPDPCSVADFLQIWDTLATSKATRTALYIVRIDSHTSPDTAASELARTGAGKCSHAEFVDMVNTLMRLSFADVDLAASSATILARIRDTAASAPIAAQPPSLSTMTAKPEKRAPAANDLSSMIKRKKQKVTT